MPGQSGDLQAWLNTLKKRAEQQQKGHTPAPAQQKSRDTAKAKSRYTEPYGHREKLEPAPRTVLETPPSNMPGGGQHRSYERAEIERKREEALHDQEEFQAERVRSTLPNPDEIRKAEARSHRRPKGETEKPHKRDAAQRPPKSAISKRAKTQKRRQEPELELELVLEPNPLRTELLQELRKGPAALRKAILLQEILQPPLGLRDL